MRIQRVFEHTQARGLYCAAALGVSHSKFMFSRAFQCFEDNLLHEELFSIMKSSSHLDYVVLQRTGLKICKRSYGVMNPNFTFLVQIDIVILYQYRYSISTSLFHVMFKIVSYLFFAQQHHVPKKCPNVVNCSLMWQ